MMYDVAIIGAGPAGCCCALALKDAGLNVVLIDKSNFPREKVCGDAISGRAIKTLKSISPIYYDVLNHLELKHATKKTAIYFNGKEIIFTWVGEAYTCTRVEFDNLLLNLVRKYTKTDIFLNQTVSKVENKTDYISITTNEKTVFKAKFIVGADGANSIVAKHLAYKKVDKNKYGASIRTYFSGVTNIETDTNYIFLDKKFFKGYIWIFPYINNMANVGMGVLSSEIKKYDVSIKNMFNDYISTNPILIEKLKNATQFGEISGGVLPFGSNIGNISGNRFILTGDSASLVSATTGDGIGNAMLSGKIAAKTIIECFYKNDFSEKFIKRYNIYLDKAIGKEIRMHYRIQQIVPILPFLLNFAFWIGKYDFFKKLIKRFM